MIAKDYLEKADKLLENLVVSGGNVFLLADARRCLAEAYRDICTDHEYTTKEDDTNAAV